MMSLRMRSVLEWSSSRRASARRVSCSYLVGVGLVRLEEKPKIGQGKRGGGGGNTQCLCSSLAAP